MLLASDILRKRALFISCIYISSTVENIITLVYGLSLSGAEGRNAFPPMRIKREHSYRRGFRVVS